MLPSTLPKIDFFFFLVKLHINLCKISKLEILQSNINVISWLSFVQHISLVCNFTYHTTKTTFRKDQRMPATGYISYPTWAHHSRIISGSDCIFLYWCMRITVRFPCSRADTLMYFPCNRAGFEQVVLLVCLLSTSFVESKSSHFAV